MMQLRKLVNDLTNNIHTPVSQARAVLTRGVLRTFRKIKASSIEYYCVEQCWRNEPESLMDMSFPFDNSFDVQ